MDREINRSLFNDFQRHQKVTKCWRKIDDQWVIKDVPFIDKWSEEEYKELISFLKNTLRTGGIVYGALKRDKLKGLASVESSLFGMNSQYLDLSNIHVSEDMRGQSIGKKLFQLSAAWARAQGAQKLYISGHSAVESQGFYKTVGCVEALEYNKELTEKEPYDCQLEYLL